MDSVVAMPRTVCVFAALVLLLIASWPGLRDLGSGIYTTYGRSGLVSVTGDLLIYLVLFGIIVWAGVQLGVNLVDNYISGRPVTLIAPVQISTPDATNAEGVRLAQLLSADLSALALTAERSLPSPSEFDLFKNSQEFKQLPDSKGGLDTIFSTTRIGNAPVVDSLNLDTSSKFEVSGTDLTPYIAWLTNKFRRHNALELTIIDLNPGRKLIWNLDTARSGWDNVTLDSPTNDAAVEEFSWKYAHSLATRSQKSTAFNALSAQQYRTIVRAYGLYADAIRAAGLEPDRDMRPTFDRVLALLETGVDPGPPSSKAQPSATPTPAPASGASGQPASANASVKEVTSQWWELSKSFAVIASLAGRQDAARTYARQALALLNTVKENRPDNAVIAALDAFASEATLAKPVLLTEKPNRSAVIFLTTNPLAVIAPHDGTTDIGENVRSTTRGEIELFEYTEAINGPVSALEAVQLSGFPAKVSPAV